MSKDIKNRKKVAGELGVSVSTTYRMQQRGELPQPRQISAGRIGWPSEEFENFKKNLPIVGASRVGVDEDKSK